MQSVDANELTGIRVYLQLPELEIDSWATLAGVGPARSEIPEPEKIDPASHRLLKLVAQREDGSRTKIELIRSVDWIREQLGESALDWANRTASQRLHLQIPELRLNNYADVLAIESCPSILDGPGEVVTATYHTDRAEVVDLQFSGHNDPLGATPSHPFWSVSRQSFIPAGELVLGEEVVGLDGRTFRLTSITPRAGPEPVFNLEVANQHTYYVSRGGLLVHNANPIYLTAAWKNFEKYIRNGKAGASGILARVLKRAGKKAKEAHHLIPTAVARKFEDWFAKAAKSGWDHNGLQNGIGRAAKYHRNGAKHANYNDKIEELIGNWISKNPNATGEQFHAYLNRLSSYLRKRLEDNPRTLLDKLF